MAKNSQNPKFTFSPQNLENSPMIKDTEERLMDAINEGKQIELSAPADQTASEAPSQPTAAAPAPVEHPAAPIPTAPKGKGRTAANKATTATTAAEEPTKGIQTAVPMSLYARLMMLKVKQGRPLRDMVTEAIHFWVAFQESQEAK